MKTCRFGFATVSIIRRNPRGPTEVLVGRDSKLLNHNPQYETGLHRGAGDFTDRLVARHGVG